MEDDGANEWTKISRTGLKKKESQMWVIARNIGDPAWTQPAAGEAQATEEDVMVCRDKDTKRRNPRRLKDAANQNTLANRDARKMEGTDERLLGASSPSWVSCLSLPFETQREPAPHQS